MDGVDLDWCLVCEKHTNGATYCSPECRSSDLVSSSASSTSSIPSVYYSSGSDTASSTGSPPSAASSIMDNYPMPPFVRKQRTSIPNIYAQCAANPNPPAHLFATPGGGMSALSHHLHQQQQGLASSSPSSNFNSSNSSTSHNIGSHPPVSSSAPNGQGQVPASATQYPLFYASLNALRSGGSPPDSSSDSRAHSRSLTSSLLH
ncbi:hypothetical protein BGW41_001743 [Actinomortierella wolfii]|nr:hypothetical protein BGW41_001743 [Actinomortierella wolfii]